MLLAANAFGAAGGATHELAAVIEFIHTATLLHDDVVDESSLRRGRKTANAEFGNAASVLVGDFLYSRAFQMIVDAGSLRVMKVLADATNVIAEGEVLQLLNVHDADTDEEQLPARDPLQDRASSSRPRPRWARSSAAPGPRRSARSPSTACTWAPRSSSSTTCSTTPATSHETGKNLGDDLAEGKPTLPLIHAMRAGTAGRARARAPRDRAGRQGAICEARRGGDPSRRARSTTRASGRAAEAAIATARLDGASRFRVPRQLCYNWRTFPSSASSEFGRDSGAHPGAPLSSGCSLAW